MLNREKDYKEMFEDLVKNCFYNDLDGNVNYARTETIGIKEFVNEKTFDTAKEVLYAQ